MKEHLTKWFTTFFSLLTPIRAVVIAVVGLFFWLVILGDKGIYQLHHLLEMKKQFTLERQTLNDEIDKLSAEEKLLSDPKNLEMVIRSELGYIKPGEIVFEEKK